MDPGEPQLDELLRTGVDEIDALTAWLKAAEVPYRTGRALDFECGLGRLTQALARTFTRCDGVDREPAAIERAREINRFGERVHYHVNEGEDLALFEDGTFDFVCSGRALEHIAPEVGAVYVHEFTRILAPGGVAVFRLPSHPLAAGEPETPPVTEIHGIRRANVEALLLAGAVNLVLVEGSDRADGWCEYRYVGIKRDPPAKTRRRLRDRLRRR